MSPKNFAMSVVNKLFRLDGRCAVVSGGAGRIGSKIAEALCSAGADVVILDVDQLAGQQQAGRIVDELSGQSDAGRCISVCADSTKSDSLRDGCEQINRAFGEVQILFNTTQFRGSGFYGSDPAEHPLEAWNKVLEVNVTGVLLACQAFHSSMKRAGNASIINVSSTYGVKSADPRIYGDSGVNSPVSYGTSKSAVLNLTRYLAVHWRNDGIRVNTLVPGGVFDHQSDEFVRNYSHRTPLGRMANAAEYQGAALFMAGDASSYMTGATVTVDGGWTAW